MNRNNGRLVFLWSNFNSKSNLGTDSKSYPSIFYCLDFVPAVPCQNIRANTDIFEISSQVNPELDKKIQKYKKSFHRIFSTSRNPATMPPSKSLHDISAKPTSGNHLSIPIRIKPPEDYL